MTSIARRLFSPAAILALLSLTFFRYGDAIVCYHCNSEYDPRCGDPFDAYSLGTVNCSFQPPLEHLPDTGPTLCRKTSQIVYGKERVVRGCGFIKDARDDRECFKRSGTHDVHAVYCACTTDLCNAASTRDVQSTILGALIAVFVMISLK